MLKVSNFKMKVRCIIKDEISLHFYLQFICLKKGQNIWKPNGEKQYFILRNIFLCLVTCQSQWQLIIQPLYIQFQSKPSGDSISFSPSLAASTSNPIGTLRGGSFNTNEEESNEEYDDDSLEAAFEYDYDDEDYGEGASDLGRIGQGKI